MCQRVKCSSCEKPTYAGCGAHVEQVLADVPKEERCKCRENKKAGATDGGGSGLLERLFGTR